jgi:hypothetical protein
LPLLLAAEHLVGLHQGPVQLQVSAEAVVEQVADQREGARLGRAEHAAQVLRRRRPHVALRR